MTDSPDDVHPDAAPSQPIRQDAAPATGSGSPDYLDSGEASTLAADASAPPRARSGRRRGLIAGAVAAVALIGGGVAYGVGQLSGGGTQPDEVVPASALAFVSVDLDPSAGQKVDALRFARKFPELKSRIGSGDDLRKMLFDAISDSSEVKGSWKDVEPWLGSRAAVAVLPASDELDEPVPVVVLAVTDEGKAKASLPTVMPKASCEISEGFAVCAQDGKVAKAAVADAAKKPLADDSSYAHDVEALGDHGILSAWVDLGRVKDAAPDLLGGMGGVAGSLAGASAADLQGRYVAAVRFDGPNLELAGHAEGVDLPALKGEADIASLPQDTLVALGIGDAGAAVTSAWQRLDDTASALGAGLDDQVSAIESTYGITLPDDLVKAVGDQLTVAVGKGSTPQVAVRVTGSQDSVERLLAAVEQASGSAVATAKSGDATVIATDDAYAKAVADGKGLGGSDRFKDAVANADGAQTALFVDIAGLVSTYGDQLGMDAKARDEIKPLSALGLAVHQDGKTMDFSVRLSTR
ncbi:MAG TPA: DUF3352 domain-containing protein [Actinomycetales bacterium]|nr:DUF3352 domain-containing protein [Actinomycetales bacterium]